VPEVGAIVGAEVFTGAGRVAGPTCVELASVEVPAELLAVAKALKKFGTSADTIV
jgi:hypothetical protein